MLIELGNHAAANGIDERPKVTYIYVPEADDRGLGGYSHEPGLTVAEFVKHRQQALDYRQGVTNLPDHEILQAVVAAWPSQSFQKPAWVKVRTHEELYGPLDGMQFPVDDQGNQIRVAPHGADSARDVENFLREFYGLDAEKPADVEDRYWTRYGAPGVSGPTLPEATALYTNAGRVISNVNDGGGQVGATGTGSAATATTLTTGATFTLNQWAGYRAYVMQTATGPLVWGNVISNTTAGVLTLDRWYSAATPGGAAPAAPSAGFYYMLADGGMVSSWFVGLTTTNITPAAADTVLSGEYTTAGGGMLRKIAPYAQTSGVASRSITLTPVFTANASDTFPSTFFAIGVFTSMVVGSAGSPMMKFETSLNASATINASGDQITVTETITGS